MQFVLGFEDLEAHEIAGRSAELFPAIEPNGRQSGYSLECPRKWQLKSKARKHAK
jgi:hypothetical protein